MSITENVFKHTHTKPVLIEWKRVWVAFTGIHLKGHTWPLFLFINRYIIIAVLSIRCVRLSPIYLVLMTLFMAKLSQMSSYTFRIKRRTKFRHLALYASIVFIPFISLQSGNDDDAFFVLYMCFFFVFFLIVFSFFIFVSVSNHWMKSNEVFLESVTYSLP